MSGPMDPERLADVFDSQRQSTAPWATVPGEALRELLADRDHWEAEAKRLAFELETYRVSEPALEAEVERWRARCPVTAEDVERAGVTREHAHRWCATTAAPAGAAMALAMATAWTRGSEVKDLSKFIEWAAGALDRPAQHILDEMAAEVAP